MADNLIGRTIGGYAILDIIGRGGMATVYRAHQVSMNRIVAIKVLPRQFVNDDTYMQRFNREVQIAARLEHRGIVPVHDYGEFDGQPYIVMRYMAGGSVDDQLRLGALPLNDILRIIDQIAPALDFAHSKNVLHRDLKPSNILLDGDGGSYLTDFGIARVLGETTGGTITTQGVIGTPSYMSPEQAQGGALDGRSDIYALGVTLFEMTTGRRPFEGDTPYNIAVKQVLEPPPLPRVYNPSIPDSVEAVILTAMSKHPDGRYPDGAALADALHRAVERRALDPLPVPQEVPVYAPPTVYPVPPNDLRVLTPTPRTPVKSRPVRKRGAGSLLFGVSVGALMGCALLTLIIAAAAFLILNTTQEERAIRQTLTAQGTSVATNSRGVTPVVQRETPVGTEEATNSPEATSTAFAPVGQIPTPTLDPAAQAAGGSIVFFGERNGNFDIFRLDLATGEETRLTTSTAADVYPTVSPDGDQIAFASDRDGDFDIYVMSIDGGTAARLTENSIPDRFPSWSPDGQFILFAADARGDRTDSLYMMRADGGELRLLFDDGRRNSHPRMGDDGHTVLFTGGPPVDAGRWEVKRLDTRTSEAESVTVNRTKDWLPFFASDGGILYSTEGDGHGAIARMDLDGMNNRIVYDGTGLEWAASYNAEGALLFTSDVEGQDELYLLVVGEAEPQRLTSAGGMYGSWVGGGG
jgi:serine/threonine protein kinase/Tol biopolymer transport system component